jgi:hypothetical protein
MVEISATGADKDGATQSITIHSSGEVGAVQAIGYLLFPEGGIRTVRMYDPAAMRSADLFATNLPIANRDVQLVLRNVGQHTLLARPRFRSSSSGSLSEGDVPLQLAAGESRIVDTTALMLRAAADPDFKAISVQIANSNPEEGSIIGSIAAYDSSSRVSFEIPLRDRGTLRTSAGSYPVRLDGDYTTIVSITNVTEEPAEFAGSIFYKQGTYSIAQRSLSPGESAIFDIADLRNRQVPDGGGTKLPSDLTNAQFNWSMLNGRDTPRLIGRSHLASPTRGISASFSCAECCPDSGVYRSVAPPGLTLTIDGFQNFTNSAQVVTCYGETQNLYESIPWNEINSSVAYSSSTSNNNNRSFGVSPGSASSYIDTFYTEYTPANCAFTETDYRLEQPETVNPTVAFGTLAAVVKGATTGIQVTVTPSPTSTPITLTLATSTGSGSAKFASNNSATMTITSTGSININGVTESSTMGNISLVASLNGKTLSSTTFTVVWVTLNIITSGSVDPNGDNGVAGRYFATTNQTTLNSPSIAFNGVLIQGTVAPVNFTGAIDLKRSKVSYARYDDLSNGSTLIPGDPYTCGNPDLTQCAGDSGTVNENVDNTPSTAGHVYDWDIPGTTINNPNSGDVGRITRTRQNFAEWASYNGVTVSNILRWYNRNSAKVAQSLSVGYESSFAGDNQAGQGTTSTAFDLH